MAAARQIDAAKRQTVPLEGNGISEWQPPWLGQQIWTLQSFILFAGCGFQLVKEEFNVQGGNRNETLQTRHEGRSEVPNFESILLARSAMLCESGCRQAPPENALMQCAYLRALPISARQLKVKDKTQT